jgi:hypothetical protein
MPANHHTNPVLSNTFSSSDGILPSKIESRTEPLDIHEKGTDVIKGGGKLKWLALGILAVVAGLYLAFDAGLFGSSINMPFHVFSQEDKTPTTSNTQSVVTPVGYKRVTIADSDTSVAYPTDWGEPTVATEDGYAERGAKNKTSGHYLYVMSFKKNTDVELSLVTSKLLPPIRKLTYYDYLQWCLGTNDGQFYQGILTFSNNGKVDQPATVVCNQGPMIGVTKINESTIVQLAAKDTAGKTAGDVYVKNLTNKTFPVVRVKDKSMKYQDQIKKILDSVVN